MRKYKIERRTLSEQVAERLEKEIRDGHYKAGDTMPSERELMEQFGVGRPAIREALFYLQKLGFVAIHSGTRPRVIKPTLDAVLPRLFGSLRGLLEEPDGQTALQEARVLFEVVVARTVAESATKADLRRLDEALAANRAAMGDEAAFKTSDVAFHAALAQATGNPIVVALHDAMALLLDDRRALVLHGEGEDQAAYRAHCDIVAAIVAGSPDGAEAAMRAHLEHHYGTYRSLTQHISGGRS